MSTKVKSNQDNPEAICIADRDAIVAELAYYKAESRGFELGHELDDWLAAEAECSL